MTMTITKEYTDQFKKCLKKRQHLDFVPNSGMLMTFKDLVNMHSNVSKMLWKEFDECEHKENYDFTIHDTLRVCEQVFNNTIYKHVVTQQDFKKQIKEKQNYNSAIPEECMQEFES